MLQRRVSGQSGGDVPELHYATDGEYGLAVGAERHGQQLTSMPKWRTFGLSRVSIPKLYRPIDAAGDEDFSVGAERHGRDAGLMRNGWADGLAGGDVPEPRRAVVTSGEHRLAVGIERDTQHSVGVGEDSQEPGAPTLPGGEVGPGGALPTGITGPHRRAPALDQTEHALADLALLAGGLTTLVVQGGD